MVEEERGLLGAGSGIGQPGFRPPQLTGCDLGSVRASLTASTKWGYEDHLHCGPPPPRLGFLGFVRPGERLAQTGTYTSVKTVIVIANKPHPRWTSLRKARNWALVVYLSFILPSLCPALWSNWFSFLHSSIDLVFLLELWDPWGRGEVA